MESQTENGFMDRKRRTYENPESIKFLSRSDATYALMKVALQVDNIIDSIRYKASPTDKVKWEQTEWAIQRLAEIIDEFRDLVQDLLQYRGKSVIAPYEIRQENEEKFIQSYRSFAILPRVTDVMKLYEHIITIDNIVHAYRMTLTTNMDPYKKASEGAVTALRTLEEYAEKIAEIAGMDYEMHPSAVKVLGLGEKVQSDQAGSSKRKKRERPSKDDAQHENVSDAAPTN